MLFQKLIWMHSCSILDAVLHYSLVTENKFIFIVRLCAEYENIAEKALTTPANTEQLMDLKKFVETTEKVNYSWYQELFAIAILHSNARLFLMICRHMGWGATSLLLLTFCVLSCGLGDDDSDGEEVGVGEGSSGVPRRADTVFTCWHVSEHTDVHMARSYGWYIRGTQSHRSGEEGSIWGGTQGL